MCAPVPPTRRRRGDGFTRSARPPSTRTTARRPYADSRDRFPEPVEVAAYFVASESLANAAKHSQASRITILLALENEALRLSVRDDGTGGADPGRGSGLVGLRDRVEALGGTLAIESGSGAGTSLSAALPVGEDAHNPTT